MEPTAICPAPLSHHFTGNVPSMTSTREPIAKTSSFFIARSLMPSRRSVALTLITLISRLMISRQTVFGDPHGHHSAGHRQFFKYCHLITVFSEVIGRRQACRTGSHDGDFFFARRGCLGDDISPWPSSQSAKKRCNSRMARGWSTSLRVQAPSQG